MSFFDLIIRWVESSDFGPRSDDLGHRILKTELIPSDLAKSDCISRAIFFSDRKIKIRSSESDRIINGLRATLFNNTGISYKHMLMMHYTSRVLNEGFSVSTIITV